MTIKKIFLTTGDVDGIGLEITAKTLLSCKSKKNQSIIFIRSPESDSLISQKKWLNKISKNLPIISTDNYLEALQLANSNRFVEIIDNRSPARWVEDCAKYCFKKAAHALVTAPLSKPEIKNAGMKDLGHTDILKRICQMQNANMGFIGEKFSVVLATGHLPLSLVEKKLSANCLNQALSSCTQLISYLPKSRAKKPIGVLGLNPHAGDQGMIGDFDNKILVPWLNQQANTLGPLIPDVAFRENNWTKYSVYLSMYHDQGLIPFKQAHGMSGVHITLGLPILRTSVDHGTAKDIFGQNIADPTSLQQALALAQNILTKSML